MVGVEPGERATPEMVERSLAKVYLPPEDEDRRRLGDISSELCSCDEGPMEGNGPSEHELSLEKVQRKCALGLGACHGTDKVVQTQATDPTHATRWKHRWEYHNKGSSGTLRLRNGLGRRIGCLYWIPNRSQKKDLVKKFLMQVGEPVEPVAETEGGGPLSGQPRKLPPMEWPHGYGWAKGKRTLEVRGTNKRVVEWINREAK